MRKINFHPIWSAFHAVSGVTPSVIIYSDIKYENRRIETYGSSCNIRRKAWDLIRRNVGGYGGE